MSTTVLQLHLGVDGPAIRVEASIGPHRVDGATTLDPLAEHDLLTAADQVAAKRMDWVSQLRFGQQLSQLLFPDEVRNVLLGAVETLDQDQRLQIHLDCRSGLTASLPWELAHVPEISRQVALGPYLALDERIAFARVVTDATSTARSSARSGSGRVVVAPATALDGWAALQSDEALLIAGALGSLPQLTCDVLDDPVSPVSLKGSLEVPVDVFHFVGHGVRGEGLVIARAGGDGSEHLGFAELGAWLGRAGVSLAVLNACDTSGGSPLAAPGAEELLRHGLAAVVAMQHPIEDSHALVFARGFYQALAAGATVDLAMHRGRQAMCLMGLSSEWAVPVLYLGANGDAVALRGGASEGPPPAVRERPVRFGLPQVAPGFAGRDAELEALGSSAGRVRDGVQLRFITGLGGVGKTQLAAAYVTERTPAFEIVAWIRAEGDATPDLVALGRQLGLHEGGRTASEQAAEVWRHLERTDRPWLIVLDNLEDVGLLAQVPSAGPGEILVTSRIRGGRAALGAEIALEALSVDAATAYLVERTGRHGDVDAARRVATALGALPLALAQAASYCAADGLLSFDDYAEMIDQLRAEILFERNLADGYELTVAATWTASIDLALRSAPKASTVLDRACFLSPDGQPRNLHLASDAPASERKAIADAFDALRSVSLVSADGEGLRIHRLLQKVVRDAMDAERASVAFDAAVAAVDRERPAHVEDPDSWPDWLALLPHIRVLAQFAHLSTDRRASLLELLGATVSFLQAAGSVADGLELAQHAVRAASKLSGSEAAETVRLRWLRARAEIEAGEARAASAELEALVQEAEPLMGRAHADVLGMRCDLVLALEAQRRSGEAITEARRLLHDCEKTPGVGQGIRLRAERALASSLRSVGRTEEAIALLEPVVAARTRRSGADPDLLVTVSLLASCYRAQGHVDRAIRVGEVLVQRCESVLGPSHLVTLRARFDLSSSYRSAGRLDQSIAIEEELVAQRTRLLGARHDETLWAMNDLTISLQSAGRTEESIALGRRLVALRRDNNGPEHSATLTAIANLAISLRAAGRLDEAIDLQRRLVEARERVLGVDHFSTSSARDHLGVSLRRAGRWRESVEVARSVVDDRTRLLGSDHPATIVAVDNLAAALRAAGQAAQAVELGTEAVARAERRLGRAHPETLWALANLAMATAAFGGDAAAMEILARARTAGSVTFGPDHPYLVWIGEIERSCAGDPAAALAEAECERVLWE